MVELMNLRRVNMGPLRDEERRRYRESALAEYLTSEILFCTLHSVLITEVLARQKYRQECRHA